jgi:hypothetical protein
MMILGEGLGRKFHGVLRIGKPVGIEDGRVL